MSADVIDHLDLCLPAGWSSEAEPSAKFLRLAHLRKLRRCEKVAAVCFRMRKDGAEFLLVQTRKQRWTFPKGSTEPGLTHAQAAALEAFEEAGVHGRMEEVPFTRYVRRKRDRMRRPAANQRSVSAHLCEVLRLGTPQECNRNPSWFSPEKAKRRLRDQRTPEYGAELARVIDRAVTRIERLRSGRLATPPLGRHLKDRANDGDLLRDRDLDRDRDKDALQKVRFIEINQARVITLKTKAASAG